MDVESIRNITIVGAGIMGHGIAQVCAQAGYETCIHETMPIKRKRAELLQQAFNKIKLNLHILVEKEILTNKKADDVLSKIKCETNLTAAVKDADFIIEAVVEDITVKKRCFKELDALCPKHAILATNTSSFSITEIASATDRQDKVVGTHWWNPPYLMPLVEIIKGDQTSTETINITRALVTRLRKTPAICKDSPGFIAVRIQAAMVMEAISVFEQGLASAEDIDTAIKMSLGFRVPILGPLETVDLGGMDTFLYAYDYLYKKLGEKYRPPDLLLRKVKSGDLGIKTGKGFYDYTDKSIESIIKRRDEWLINQLKKTEERIQRHVPVPKVTFREN